ncbi:CRISPR-associated endoribonuclease Cas6 [Parafrankia irregularis]|uniref:CRISPR-associated endoribonuclease Cas6 n=1 Tax=Parafrankia irregularis TaxID=795642 RepID=UPI001F6260FD|nr:CRISPR-associated endoribonuclease Cas6 [Parafrankia irregularis]
MPTIPWRDVFGPARAVAYHLINRKDSDLATELHDQGYAGSSLRPLGLSPPSFRGTSRGHNVYRASGDGSLWFGSPVPRIAAAILAGLAGQRQLQWGSVELDVHGIQLVPPPDHSAGEAVFDTSTPVLVRHSSRYIFPGDPEFIGMLEHNLRHKADLLELPNQVDIEVLSAGRPRKFLSQNTPRHGCLVRTRVRAAPALLDALYDWGLGLNTNQGFGWIR